MKIPEPTTPPITSMVAANNPSRRARDCEFVASDWVAGEPTELTCREGFLLSFEKLQFPIANCCRLPAFPLSSFGAGQPREDALRQHAEQKRQRQNPRGMRSADVELPGNVLKRGEACESGHSAEEHGSEHDKNVGNARLVLSPHQRVCGGEGRPEQSEQQYRSYRSRRSGKKHEWQQGYDRQAANNKDDP